MPPKAPKASITCNWMRSNVTSETLADFVKSGYLPKKESISYRAPDPSEERPQPKDGEVVIFADHMSRGFAPPGSKFFRDVLNFFDLRPQDIGPNSVSNICNFQVFCEVYLGEEPSLLLFRELFYLNRQNECANGQVWNLAESPFSDGETASSLTPSRQATQRTGTRRGSTAKTRRRLTRARCPAFAPRVWNQHTLCQTS